MHYRNPTTSSLLVDSAEKPPAALDHLPNGDDTQRDWSLASVAQFGLIQQVAYDLLFGVLFDGGRSHTLIKQGSLP
jgi:hypothetical protein